MADSQVKFVTILVIAIAVGIVALAFVWDAELEDVCVDNGYAEHKTIGFKSYCIGVRGGDTVVVPIEDLD